MMVQMLLVLDGTASVGSSNMSRDAASTLFNLPPECLSIICKTLKCICINCICLNCICLNCICHVVFISPKRCSGGCSLNSLLLSVFFSVLYISLSLSSLYFIFHFHFLLCTFYSCILKATDLVGV